MDPDLGKSERQAQLILASYMTQPWQWFLFGGWRVPHQCHFISFSVLWFKSNQSFNGLLVESTTSIVQSTSQSLGCWYHTMLRYYMTIVCGFIWLYFMLFPSHCISNKGLLNGLMEGNQVTDYKWVMVPWHVTGQMKPLYPWIGRLSHNTGKNTN